MVNNSNGNMIGEFDSMDREDLLGGNKSVNAAFKMYSDQAAKGMQKRLDEYNAKVDAEVKPFEVDTWDIKFWKIAPSTWVALNATTLQKLFRWGLACGILGAGAYAIRGEDVSILHDLLNMGVYVSGGVMMFNFVRLLFRASHFKELLNSVSIKQKKISSDDLAYLMQEPIDVENALNQHKKVLNRRMDKLLNKFRKEQYQKDVAFSKKSFPKGYYFGGDIGSAWYQDGSAVMNRAILSDVMDRAEEIIENKKALENSRYYAAVIKVEQSRIIR